MKTNKIICALLLVAAAFTAKAEDDPFAVFGTEGTGESLVYTISNVDQWNALSAIVASGNKCSGMTFKLLSNISVATTVGCQYSGTAEGGRKRFSGIFDGNGKTIEINLTEKSTYSGANGNSPNPNYCAPFAYTECVTIKNLRVLGTISTTGCYCGGLIGSAAKTNANSQCATIENCWVSVTITNRKKTSGSAYPNQGGVVGIAEGAISFVNCVFDGQFLVADGGDYQHSGGFVGIAKTKSTFSNCLFNPSRIEGVTTYAQSFAHKTNGEDAAVKPKTTSPDFYYVTPFSVNSKNNGICIVPSLQLCEKGTALNLGLDGKTYYKITGSESKYLQGQAAIVAGQTKYMTTLYHSRLNFSLPATAQALTMDGNYKLYAVGNGNVVPAGCAVIIMSDTEYFTITPTDATATPVSGNILQGTTEECSTPSGNVYVMVKNGESFGFIRYTGATLPQNKVYYIGLN